MWKYFLKTFCIMLVALFLIILLTFTIMHAIPGKRPFTSNKQVSEEVEAALNAKFNLDAPLHEQFFLILAVWFTVIFASHTSM